MIPAMFYLGYNFIFKTEIVYFLDFAITRYIAAYLIALSISFPIGFCLNKFIVFQQSNLKSQVQLIRYAFITVLLSLNNILFLYFDDIWQWQDSIIWLTRWSREFYGNCIGYMMCRRAEANNNSLLLFLYEYWLFCYIGHTSS